MNSFPYRFEPPKIQLQTTPSPDTRIYPSGQNLTPKRQRKETPKTRTALNRYVSPSVPADLTAFFASVPVTEPAPIAVPTVPTSVHTTIAVVPPKEMPKITPKKAEPVKAVRFAAPEPVSSVRQFVTAFLQK